MADRARQALDKQTLPFSIVGKKLVPKLLEKRDKGQFKKRLPKLLT